MAATQNLAAAQKIDLQSAASLVAKSIGSNVNALGRYGVQVNSSASKTEKMAQLIESLDTKFGGAAAAAAQGAGSIKQVENILGDLGEELGKKSLPLVTEFAKALKTAGEYWINFLSDDGGPEKLKQTSAGLKEVEKEISDLEKSMAT